MSKKLFSKFIVLLLVVGLLFAVAPTKQAQAQTPTTLNVADWSETAPVGVTGRPSVLFDGTTYHMWYGSDAGTTALYHTTSTDPAAFTAGTQVTFNGGTPLEQSSVTVIKEADGFKMIAYGADAHEFALYTSTDGTAWTKGATVFNATGMDDLGKIDAPFVFNDGGVYKLYFQKKSADGQSYNIYLATSSTIGGTYTLHATNPVLSPSVNTEDWDGKFVMHPTVAKDGDTYYMYYSAHNNVLPQRIGLATSPDGINWTKSPANPVIGSVGEPSVIKVGDTWHMYYLGTGSAVQHVSATGPFEFQTIQAAVTASADGDVINVAAGIYDVPTTITLDKAISIIGPTTGEAKVIGTGTDMFKVFAITSSNVTIKDLEITLAVTPASPLLISDELNSSLISISGGAGMTGIIIQGNEIYVPVQTPPMTGWTARALTVGSNTVSDMVISGNTVYNTRNGIVIQGNNSATITGNTIYNTKGGIMNYTGTAEDAAARVMTNNSWGTVHNEWDIVWNSGGGPYDLDENVLVLGISQSNNDAYVVSLMPTAYTTPPQLLNSNRSHVFVNATTGGTETLHNANGNINLPYKKIKDAIDAVVPGGKVYVAAGTYAEQLTINKAVTLLGPNAGISAGVTPGMRVPEATVTFPTGLPIDSYLVSITSDNVTIDGFDFTYQEYLIALRPTLIGAKGVDNLTIVNNRFFGGEVAVEFVPTTTKPYSVALLIEDNYVDSGPFVNSRYNRGFYIYGTGGVIKNNVVLNTSVGIQILPHREPTGGTVEGNIVSGYSIGLYQNNHWADSGAWSWKDNTVTMALNDRLGLKAQVNLPYTADVTFRGVHLINYGIYGGTVPPVATFEGNSIDGASVGSVGVIGVDAIRINSTDSPFVPGTTATFRENSFINYTTAINNIAYGSTSVIVDAIENWWGSVAGPAAGTIVGNAAYAPWCGDAECSFLVYLAGSDLQAAINATPAGGTLYVPDLGPDSDYTVSYTVGGKTLILGEGVTIQASSPCFTVTGDNTIITAETIGGAKCVQSDTYGIEVNAGLKNVVIEGIYFDTDAGEMPGSIHFAGAIEDVLINDNYFRGYAAKVYDGIVFAQQPTGVVEIKGNFFEMSGSIVGCAVNNFYGTSTIDAQFNSFGSMDGHPASVSGERICEHVDYSNFTHADVYLESSATPWANQEVVGQEFTLTVKANLTEVTGAKFTLKYNPALVDLDAVSLANLSRFSAAGPNLFEVDETLGLITFNASTYPAITGANYSLFSANFTASAVGAALFEVDALSDEFAMFPGYASSSNVYGYTLLPVTVDLIELPTVASTFGDSYYLVGEARDFTMTVTNFDTAYAAPELRITIPAGLTLTYGGTPYTGSLVVDLAELAVDDVVTLDLTATFTAPFNTTAAVLDVDLVDKLTPEELLVEASFSAFAYTKPTVTIGTDPYFLVGVPGDFSVTIMNPETGRNYGDSIVFDIVIEDHVVADISAVSCTMGTQTWDLIGELEQDDTDVVARIEGLTGGFFTVPANFTAPISCSITYATPGTYAVSGYMVEGISSPERIVSDTYSATTQVYTQPVITSDNLDGPFQAGLAQGVTLTITNPSPIPEPFDLVFTLPAGTTIVYNGVTYTCDSTGCPPIPLVAGAVPGDINVTITFPAGFVGGTANVSVSLIDHDTGGAPSPLAILSMEDVVVYANVAAVTGTVSMQGRTTRAGVLVTLAGSFDTYTATSINTLSNNVSFTNLASGLYAITVEQARYLDITIAHGATIDLADLQAIANLMLRAGDANDDNYINGGDASIVGGQYGTGTIADQGDINFDNRVNIQDLALIGGNLDLQSADPLAANYAYGDWMK